MNPYAIALLLSILAYMAIGTYAGRKVKKLDDYFVSGRRAPTLLIVGTLVASFLSTNTFLGETGFAYQGYGVPILILTSINSLGFVVGALFFGRFIRRSQALTVSEYFGKRFNSQRVRTVSGLTIIVGLTAYLLAVTQGASIIFSEVMEIPYGTALFLVWLGYTLFTLQSGSRGVVITDTVMFLLFTSVAVISLPFIIGASGGWFQTISTLATYDPKPGIISWHGLSGPGANWETPTDVLQWTIILGISWAIVLATSPWQTSRYLMAKSEHTVIRSACISSGVFMVLVVALMFSAAAINLSHPNIEPTDKAMIWAALNLMPTFSGAVLMAGLMAAALSSASTFLSLVGFSASQDLFELKTTDTRKRLQISRYTMLAMSMVALALAYFQPPAIMWITYFAGTLFASSWGPVTFMSVWSKTITESGAFWGIITGFLGNSTAKLLTQFEILSLPIYLDPIVIGASLSIASIVIASRFGTVTEPEKRYREQMHQTPIDELNPAQLRQTLIWPVVLILGGVAITVLLIVFYVNPYQAALGGISSVSGEMLMAIGFGLSLVLGGGIAYRWTKRIYEPKGQPTENFEIKR